MTQVLLKYLITSLLTKCGVEIRVNLSTAPSLQLSNVTTYIASQDMNFSIKESNVGIRDKKGWTSTT